MKMLHFAIASIGALACALAGAGAYAERNGNPNAATLKDAEMRAFMAEYVRPRAIPFPDDNAYTPGKATLGKQLFFDPRLSGSGAISCASCHNPGLGWEDGLKTGIGHMGASLGRHTPTTLNLAWGVRFFWDGRAGSLEEQALGPIKSSVEMNLDHEAALKKLTAIPGYVAAFEAEFPGQGITLENIGKAIATFERTIVSNDAPFDRWIKGDEAAISDEAKRGFQLFNTKANCAVCHSGWRFTDDGFHDIGVASSDNGRGDVLKIPAMQRAFKTPTLRNIDQRAPFLHNGSAADLMAVVDLYDNGFERRPTLSAQIKPLSLSDKEKRELVEFLKALTSEDDPVPVPVLPK